MSYSILRMHTSHIFEAATKLERFISDRGFRKKPNGRWYDPGGFNIFIEPKREHIDVIVFGMHLFGWQVSSAPSIVGLWLFSEEVRRLVIEIRDEIERVFPHSEIEVLKRKGRFKIQ